MTYVEITAGIAGAVDQVFAQQEYVMTSQEVANTQYLNDWKKIKASVDLVLAGSSVATLSLSSGMGAAATVSTSSVGYITTGIRLRGAPHISMALSLKRSLRMANTADNFTHPYLIQQSQAFKNSLRTGNALVIANASGVNSLTQLQTIFAGHSVILDWINSISDNSILVKLVDDIAFNPDLVTYLKSNPYKKEVWELIHKSAYSADESVLNYVDEIKSMATLGIAPNNNYKNTFFSAFPNYSFQGNGFVVHHAIEQQIATRYPNLFTTSEINSLNNLRGISPEVNSSLHLSNIRKEWNKFYDLFPEGITPTRKQVLDKATEIDNMFGGLFTPPIRSI